MHLYADDVVLLVADIKTEEIHVKLTREINCAARWLTAGKLTLHIDKVKHITFGSKQN